MRRLCTSRSTIRHAPTRSMVFARLKRKSPRRTDSVSFFFQAEDGIRDLTVTGVQTCALPIWLPVEHPIPLREPLELLGLRGPERLGIRFRALSHPVITDMRRGLECIRGRELPRSEERRVGKECRARLSMDD